MSIDDVLEGAKKWLPFFIILGVISTIIIDAIDAFGWSWTVAGYIVIAVLSLIFGYLIAYWHYKPTPISKPQPKAEPIPCPLVLRRRRSPIMNPPM